jgi:glycosyltransferase involved in cell wall biosynthesis
VRFAGSVDRDGVASALRAAAILVAPSTCYETFGLAVAEAMACGTPSVVPGGTALAECVDPGRTGLHFASGDVGSLRDACRRLLADPDGTEEMGWEARGDYEDRFAPSVSLAALLAVYQRAIAAVG